MDPITLLWLLHLGSAALLTALSVPLIRGRIPPNPWYGFRVPRTLEDPEVWYRANRYSGRLLFGFGLAFGLVTTGVRWLPGMSLEAYAWTSLAVAVVGLGLVVGLSFRHLHTLAK